MGKTVYQVVLALILLVSTSASYNESHAIELAHIAGATYCHPEQLTNMTCGGQCSYLKPRGWSTFFSAIFPNAGTTLEYSLFVNTQTSDIVVSFRGTTDSVQLMWEILLFQGVHYKLQSLPNNPLVEDYFYSAYRDVLRSSMQEQLKKARALYPNYQVSFTGHSLGAALTAIAATDAVYSGIVEKGKVLVYTFGSPRVGNPDFNAAFTGAMKEVYRLVHHKDLVPHVPPCIPNLSGDCIKSGFGELLWFPYHYGNQVFYDSPDGNPGTQRYCDEEDSTCQNKYSLITADISDHGHYVGIRVGCNGNGPFTDIPL